MQELQIGSRCGSQKGWAISFKPKIPPLFPKTKLRSLVRGGVEKVASVDSFEGRAPSEWRS
jgi:hypothetical protein